MRRAVPYILLLVLIVPPTIISAGGIVTNTNQSASYVRNPALGATISPEATYYNPAATALLGEGYHLSFSNQFIHQVRRIESTSPIINRDEFRGRVTAPLFPTLYGVFRMDDWAVSLGINPIGGGGTARFSNGLPSIEHQLATVPALLDAQGIETDRYSYNTNFHGQSIYWGIQANGAYQVHEMVSVSLGLRCVIANNSYNGYFMDMRINPTHTLNPDGGMVTAAGFFNSLSRQASSVASIIQPAIDDGAGDYTLEQLQAAQLMDESLAQQLAGGLGDSYNEEMTLSQIQGAYEATAETLSATAMQTSDKVMDVSQRGFSIAPIVGVHVQVNDEINVGVKYEHKAPLTVRNRVRLDQFDLYTHNAKVANDMPSLLSLGASYRVIDDLTVSAGFNYYLDRLADYGISDAEGNPIPNKDAIDGNSWELAVGGEYTINDVLMVSGGYLRAQTRVNELFQSDMTHSLPSNTMALGGRYLLDYGIGLNFGTMLTFYSKNEKQFDDNTFTYSETYRRFNMVLAVGVDYSF